MQSMNTLRAKRMILSFQPVEIEGRALLHFGIQRIKRSRQNIVFHDNNKNEISTDPDTLAGQSSIAGILHEIY